MTDKICKNEMKNTKTIILSISSTSLKEALSFTKIEFPVVVFSAILKIPQIHVYCAGLFAI
jgi:hypothetical protein